MALTASCSSRTDADLHASAGCKATIRRDAPPTTGPSSDPSQYHGSHSSRGRVASAAGRPYAASPHARLHSFANQRRRIPPTHQHAVVGILHPAKGRRAYGFDIASFSAVTKSSAV